MVSGAAVLLAQPAAWPVPPRLPCHAVCSGGFVEARRGDGCEVGGGELNSRRLEAKSRCPCGSDRDKVTVDEYQARYGKPFIRLPGPRRRRDTMTVDQYAICPCGNGKKIKFCKCKDSLPELDRVSTMINGGQIVPALDRLNRILEEHPDAAWALAIKGRVLMSLREYQSLAENAERFIRLQPTNPLALGQRAAARLFDNQGIEATESLLEAVAESGNDVDEFVLGLLPFAAAKLAQDEHYLSARALCTLALGADDFDGSRQALQLLQELNRDDSVNRLLKSLPPSRPRPDGVDWAERFDEALGLLQSDRVALAKTKFASLARAYPGEPSILSGLLSCAIWQVDRAAQADCFARLSQCEQLDEAERSKQLALSYAVDPENSPAALQAYHLVAEVDDVLRIEQALQADRRCVQLPEPLLRNFADSEDDVPPRSAFQILDQPMPGDDAELVGGDLPIAVTILLLFGKQTDRAARLEIPGAVRQQLDQIGEPLKAAIGEVTWTEQPVRRIPLSLVAEVQPPLLPQRGKRVMTNEIYQDFRNAKLADQLLNLELPTLGERSLLETRSDDSLRLQRAAIMRLLENQESIAESPAILTAIRDGAGLQPLPQLTAKTGEDVEQVDNADLLRIDCSQLNSEGLGYLLHRAQSLNMRSLLQLVGKEILRRELAKEDTGLKSAAYAALVESAQSPDEALAYSAEAQQYCDEEDLDKAQFLLMELPVLVRKGDPAALQSLVQRLTRDYGNRDDVMATLHQLLYALGLINVDGTPRLASASMAPPAAAAAADSSTLWTPDGDTAGQPASDGGSKLWIPGMD